MSFYEWWAESGNRGPIGTIKFGQEHEACRCRPLVIARFVFTVIALPAIWVISIPLVPLPLWQSAAAVIGGTLVYVALSYLVTPEPDMGNMGMASGLFDNPFRYSDDVNRNLAGLAMLLGPGRFVAESLIDIRVLFEQPPEPDEFGDVSTDGDEAESDADPLARQYLDAQRDIGRPTQPEPDNALAEELAASGLSSARFMQPRTGEAQQGGWSRLGR